MKRFQELLMKDLGWKLLSVAIATTMWFMVISINQPIDTRTYSTTLAIVGQENLTAKGLTISNQEELEKTKISIKIKAQRTSLDRLSQKQTELVAASIDVSALTYVESGDTVTLPITTNIANGASGYTVESKTPATAEVQIETLVSKEFPVHVVLNGEPSGKLSTPTLSTNTVMVKGAKSLVNAVYAVRVFVNAAEAEAQSTLTVTPVAYDKDGNTINGVSFSQENITVSYQLQSEKEIPIHTSTQGTPAEGYHVGEIVCVPQSIVLVGSADSLNKIDEIVIDAVNVSNAVQDVTQSVSLQSYLPQGVTTSSGQSSAFITVSIEKGEEQTIDIPSTQITLTQQNELYTYHMDDMISLTVTGAKDVLSQLQPSTIVGTADVSTLQAEQSSTEIVWTLPEGVSVVSSTFVVSATSNETEQPEEQEPPTEIEEEPPTQQEPESFL